MNRAFNDVLFTLRGNNDVMENSKPVSVGFKYQPVENVRFSQLTLMSRRNIFLSSMFRCVRWWTVDWWARSLTLRGSWGCLRPWYFWMNGSRTSQRCVHLSYAVGESISKAILTAKFSLLTVHSELNRLGGTRDKIFWLYLASRFGYHPVAHSKIQRSNDVVTHHISCEDRSELLQLKMC